MGVMLQVSDQTGGFHERLFRAPQSIAIRFSDRSGLPDTDPVTRKVLRDVADDHHNWVTHSSQKWGAGDRGCGRKAGLRDSHGLEVRVLPGLTIRGSADLIIKNVGPYRWNRNLTAGRASLECLLFGIEVK
jgi:hypothetical protein